MAPRDNNLGGGKSAEEVMDEMAGSLFDQTPQPFDYEELERKFPTDYHESSNTVLKQESLKYNRLLNLMRGQLPLFRKALKGLVVMSEDLENLGRGIFTNVVPETWASVGFLSLMALNGWMKDLSRRVKFIDKWIKNGIPSAFWISGFFFPQAFLTGVLQNDARKNKIAIDRLSFTFVICDYLEPDGSDATKPEQGVFIYGI